MTKLPTGEQYRISADRYAVEVTEVGATLRSLKVDGTEWLWTFEADAIPVGHQGKHLFPWPNRVADGRYRFDGADHQLDITEVDRYTALHGLNAGRPWELVSHTPDTVVQRHTFYPENGWTGILTAEVTHSVSADGLQVRIHVVNDGATDLPYGYGVHPYFAFANVDDVVMRLPFDSELFVDAERLLPLSVGPVSPEHDFREARAFGSTEFDTALTAPSSAAWTMELTGDGRTVQVWADETLPWIQIYTTRPTRNAIAVEPMTCGPDAFNEGPTHDSLIVLAPGATSTSVWGVRSA